MVTDTLVTLAQIHAADNLIRSRLHRTPVFSATALGAMVDVQLHLKAEVFQKTGSFKPRGILNCMYHLAEPEKARGVITVSAGNAAQAVAFGAAQLGIPATVVMPATATQSKVDATRGYGARVVQHGSVMDLFPKMQEIQQAEGQVFIHPFDDLALIAGHGTLGLEILEDVPGVETVIVPVGGGGLIAGVAAAIKQTKPAVRVVGVEPEGAASMKPSLAQGSVQHLERTDTIADGLAAPFAGAHCLRHVQQFVDELVLVTDDEIMQSLRLVLERGKILTEPAAAASFAALLSGKLGVRPQERIVCILSGGNVDRALLRKIL